MNKFIGMRWLVVAAGAAMLLVVAAACGTEIKEVEVPGETVTVIKEVIKEVEVPGKTIVVEKEVVKEVEVPGETVVVEKEVVKTVEVEKVIAGPERIVIKEVPGKKYVTDPVTGRVFTAPEYGGTFTPAIASDANVIAGGDPYLNLTAMYLVGRIVNEKLGALDWALDRDAYSFPGGAMTPVWAQRGALAESWSQPDETTYVVNIREGVYWHDKPPMNGRELTAEDVEYTFRRYLGLWEFADAGPGVWTGEFGKLSWESITATDKYTVVFKLKEPNTRALMLILDWWHSLILPPEVIEQHGDIGDWRNLVGTGPYELTDWAQHSAREYTKNPNYWGFDPKWPENRLPYFDKIEVLIIPEVATRLAALRSGKIDYLGQQGTAQIVVVDQALSLQRTNPELQLWPWSTRSDSAAALNLSKPPFDDIRVRHAMQMALDLETMNDTYFKGFADWIPHGNVGSKSKDYMTPFEEWNDELKGYYTYDPAGAEALLDEAGYPRGDDGIRTKITFVHSPRMAVSWTEFMVSYWSDIGIAVDIDTTSKAEFNARRNALDYDLIWTASGINEDPVWNMTKFRTDGLPGWTVSDAKFDAWYDAVVATTSLEEQKRLVKQMDMHMIEQHWVIWGPAGPQFNASWPWLMGYDGEGVSGGGTALHIFQYLWFDSEMKAAMGY